MKRKIELFLRTAIARGYVRLAGQFTRDLNWIITSILGAFLTIATYVYLYKSIGASEEFSGIVLLGGFMTPYWLNVLWSIAAQLYWEREMGNLQFVIISPAPLSAFLLGLTIGGFIQTSIRAVLILLMGIFIFDITLNITNISTIVLVFLISIYAIYSVGLIFSSLFLFYGREFWRIIGVIQEPVSIASGFYFPVKILGGVGASIVSLIPLTLGLDALRQLLIPSFKLGFLSWKVETLTLLFMGTIFMFIAIRLLNYVEILAKKEGRLTLKWQ